MRLPHAGGLASMAMAVTLSLAALGLSFTPALAGPAAAMAVPLVANGAASVPVPTSAQPAPDGMTTGSIGLTLGPAPRALHQDRIDRAVAGTVSTIQVPSYLSILADRRMLVLLSLLAAVAIWINRLPPTRKDRQR